MTGPRFTLLVQQRVYCLALPNLLGIGSWGSRAWCRAAGGDGVGRVGPASLVALAMRRCEFLVVGRHAEYRSEPNLRTYYDALSEWRVHCHLPLPVRTLNFSGLVSRTCLISCWGILAVVWLRLVKWRRALTTMIAPWADN